MPNRPPVERHQEVKIIMGIPKAIGDTNSAENGIDANVINLLGQAETGGGDGFLIDPMNNWTPQIAQVKNGGIWVESALTDGRQLLATSRGNVVETITCIATASTEQLMATLLSRLFRLAQNAENFWTTQWQIEPVYLKWWGRGAPGAQYALISEVNIAITELDYPGESQQAFRQVVLTIEREAAWRWEVPPGGNPKLWSFYSRSERVGIQKAFADLTLIANSDHLITQTVQNKHEWQVAGFGLQVSPLSINYIPIPAAKVPGDMPALVEMSITGDTEGGADVYISRSSRQFSGTGHDSVARKSALILNVGDSNVTALTKTVGIVSTGVLSNGSNAVYYYGARTSTGVDAVFQTACAWGDNTGTARVKLDREFFRGSFAIFCRARNNSAAPVVTDMQMRIVIEEYENAGAASAYSQTVTLPTAQVPVLAAGAPLVYMGTVTLPLSNRTVQSPAGYGVQLQETLSNLRVTLQQQVLVVTANRIFEVIDVIFMPIDEGMTQIVFAPVVTLTTSSYVSIVDNTGYLQHGQAGQNSVGYITNSITGGVNQEIRGADITLLPKVDQRLYFIMDSAAPAATPTSRLQQTLVVRLNIVPRSMGMRDT